MQIPSEEDLTLNILGWSYLPIIRSLSDDEAREVREAKMIAQEMRKAAFTFMEDNTDGKV